MICFLGGQHSTAEMSFCMRYLCCYCSPDRWAHAHSLASIKLASSTFSPFCVSLIVELADASMGNTSPGCSAFHYLAEARASSTCCHARDHRRWSPIHREMQESPTAQAQICWRVVADALEGRGNVPPRFPAPAISDIIQDLLLCQAPYTRPPDASHTPGVGSTRARGTGYRGVRAHSSSPVTTRITIILVQVIEVR